MHSEKCPVCKGQGAIPMLHSTACRAVCHGCQGKGWIEVRDLEEKTMDQILRAVDTAGKYMGMWK